MKKRTIAYLLTLFILCQSCVIYQNTSVPIESAIDKGQAKLIMKSGKKVHLDKIEKEDSLYYAWNSMWEDKILIYPTSVEAIYLKDSASSTAASVVLFVILPIVALIVIYFNCLPYGC